MRRTGLSYNAKVQPLLKHGIKRPEPEVDAPPLSTDESEDEDVGISLTHRSSPKKGSWLTDMVPGSSSDIEGDERNRKANIAPTKFASKRPSPDAPSYGTRKKSKRSKLSDDEPISSKSTSKGGSSKRSATSSSAKHLKDEHGFITTKSAKSTYGKRKADSSDPLSSQTEKPRLRRIPSPLRSPERPKRQFRAPSKDILSSPEEKPSLKLTNLDDILDSDPENDISPEVQALLKTKSKTKPKELRSKKAKAKARRDALKSPSPPRAVFKLPTFHDTKADGEDDYISSEEDQPTAEPEPESQVIKPATCPWCGVEVDRTLLESFSKGKPRLTVQLQTKFCKKHKTRSAKEEWKEKGYPEIDWDNLDQQFAKHRDFLLGVINGEASHYRSIMAGLVRSGKSRVLKQEDDLNPGYYGPRGFNVMSDYLVGEFRDNLKDRAVDDRVISGRGSAAFIQFVLVAELGTRLIMDDMGLDEDGARELMEKTKEIGIILHEDG